MKDSILIRYKYFEYNFIPIRLTNAVAIFHLLMNVIFEEIWNKFDVCYFNDMLIYSKSFEEHEEYIQLILQKLLDARLYVKLKKCIFY